MGVRGAVGSLAAQLARRGGATVIGTVRRGVEAGTVLGDVVSHLVALDGSDPVARIRDVAPDGVDRVIEVALSAANVSLRLIGSDDFPTEAKRQAACDITRATAAGQLFVPIASPYSLDDIAAAHQAVESGRGAGRILVSIGG